MAFAVMQTWPGAELSQYDQITPKLDSTPSGNSKGVLSHWVTKSDRGILVVDVWENREDFQKFADEQLIPISQEVGLPNPPKITIHELHHYFTKDAV